MTGFDPGSGWVRENRPDFGRTMLPPPQVEYVDHVDTDGRLVRYFKRPQYRDWTVLVKVGGMEEPTNYYLKTPWEWCIRMGNGTWGVCAPGWYPPDGCEVLSGGPL